MSWAWIIQTHWQNEKRKGWRYIDREIHKLRHLEVVRTVDWKLEKQDLSKQEIENGALTE